MSLANIAALLAKEKAVKSTGFLKSAIDGINQAQDSGGLSEAKELFEKFSPASGLAATAFGAFVESVKAESTTEAVGLFKELMELFGLDDTEKGASAISDMVGDITGAATDLVSITNSLSTLLGGDGIFLRIGRALLNIFVPLEFFIELLNQLAINLERINAADPNTSPGTAEQQDEMNWWERLLYRIRAGTGGQEDF